MYWEVFMTVIFFLTLIFIPIDIIMNFHNYTPFDSPLVFLTTVLDVACIVDIFCSFVTGYVDDINKEVILDRHRVAWFAASLQKNKFHPIVFTGNIYSAISLLISQLQYRQT